jgi:uncharacterized membrane protein YgcG
MQELFIFGVAISGIFSLLLSAMLLRLGLMIDRFPVGDEEPRDRSLWSPREFTRISVMIFWPLFIVGGYMMLSPSRVVMVVGITTLVGMVLFLVTAVVFSVSVLNIMKRRGDSSKGRSPAPGFFGGASSRKNPARQMKSSPGYRVSANRK